MKQVTHQKLIVATMLIVAGTILLIVALAMVNFDFSRLSTQSFEMNTYAFKEEVNHIVIHGETDRIIIAPSKDGICRVECYETETLKHHVAVSDDKLIISVTDNRKWHDYIDVNFQTPTIRVYLPRKDYTSLSIATVTGDIEVSEQNRFETVTISGTTANVSYSASVSKSIEVHTTTGDITIESIRPKTIELSATTGTIKVNDVASNRFTAKNKTGNIRLHHAIMAEDLCIETATGEVEFRYCDANQISIKSNTGNVKGCLLSEKIFVTETVTGNVSVPKTMRGGECKIITSTGNIEVELESES